jgi:hypothetical protein
MMEFTESQLRRMATDKDFQARLESDPELRRIAERVDDRNTDSMEAAAAIGAPCVVCGMTMPQPTAGTLTLLELLGSPFLTGGMPTREDVEKAAYVIHARVAAVKPIFAAFRFQQKMQDVKAIAEKSPDALMVWLRFAHDSSAAWADFDTKAAEFAQTLGVYRFDDAVSDIYAYLALCGGFAMIPDSGDAEKKMA